MKLLTVFNRLTYLMLLTFGFAQQDTTKKVFVNQIGPIIWVIILYDKKQSKHVKSNNYMSI